MAKNKQQGTDTTSGIGIASGPLYSGDTGKLPFEARKVLVSLLAGPSIEEKRHPELWPALIRYESEVRSSLADMFLSIEIDKVIGVAFIRQADTGELEAPKLVRRTPLTFIQSALILYLRRVLMDAISRGEIAIVSKTEMVEELKVYEPDGNTDRVGFEKRIATAIDQMKKKSVISLIRGSDEQFEISGTLKFICTPEQVESFTQQYKNRRDGAAAFEKEFEEESE